MLRHFRFCSIVGELMPSKRDQTLLFNYLPGPFGVYPYMYNEWHIEYFVWLGYYVVLCCNLKSIKSFTHSMFILYINYFATESIGIRFYGSGYFQWCCFTPWGSPAVTIRCFYETSSSTHHKPYLWFDCFLYWFING